MANLPRSPVQALLDANAEWVDIVNAEDPGFFPRSAQDQSPKVLWIGCADSRVPESVITRARPGDIFVHRNIANQFHPDDDSAQAVLSFAVGVIGVEHIVLAGHTRCGGAAACYKAVTDGSKPIFDTPLSRWLAPLTALVASLDLPADPDAAVEAIVVENVKRQVANICAAEPVRRAWAEGKPVQVHGWIYHLASGRIKDLGLTRGSPESPSGGV